MLIELDIKNFAIIKDIKVEFDQGMTVLMGETGAGKSILIDALSMLLGHRASSEMIRTGSEQASVTGLFAISEKNQPTLSDIFRQNGWDLADEIVIQRQISTKGRNVVRINGQLSTINVLAEIGKYLVDIHGQQDQQLLMDENEHLNLLQQFDFQTIKEPLAAYQEVFLEWQALIKQKTNLEKNSQKIAQQQDILKFQLDEIESAQIKSATEDTEFDDEFNKLKNFQKISDLANELQQLLENEEANVVDQVGTGMNLATELAKYSQEYQNLSQSVNDAYYALDDARTSIGNVIDNLDFDEEHFQAINERIIVLNNLKKKYGPDLSDVLQFAEEKAAELAEYANAEFDTEKLNQKIAAAEEKLTSLSQKLHKIREASSKKLVHAIQAQLKDLYMAKAEFAVHFTHANQFLPTGQDIVEFYISTNPGEILKPLVKIASGGEQSRIVLAVKVILGQLSNVQTMIFDEIDTGVSGRVAAAIGEKMLQLSQTKQVITITHSPQVAATANHRFLIEKTVADDKTYTLLNKLDYNQSVDAIAKMMAGNEVTDATVTSAEELLAIHKK